MLQFEKSGLFDEELLIAFKETIAIGEDTCLWIDIAYSYSVGGLEEPLSAVRVGGSTSAFNIDKQRIAYLNISEHIVENPLYAVYEHERNLLLNQFLNLLKH